MEEEFGKPLEGEMELIHRFTRRALEDKDVYAFSVVLCDNEVDRDFERFSEKSLEKLAELFIGVTGITDHDPKSSNQSARIFDCRVEQVRGKLTSQGDAYCRVVARAYVPRNRNSEALIQALDSGIKKEVSVGCAVRKRICSVCGKEFDQCRHHKGQRYGGKLCFVVLEEPTDAYEWSFVAVPAQKGAGVIKCFRCDDRETVIQTDDGALTDCSNVPFMTKGGIALDVEKKLWSTEEQVFSAEELSELARKFHDLEKRAFDGDYFRDCLVKEIRGLSAVVLPELGTELLQKMTDELSVRQLAEMKKAFEQKAAELLPMKPQLSQSGSAAGNDHRNNQFYQNI